MKFWKRKYWLLVAALGFGLMLAPLFTPSLATIIGFFIGMPLCSTGFLMYLITRPGKVPKWKFTEVYALTIYDDHTYSVHQYNPNNFVPEDLPEHIRPYAEDYRYIMALKGWVPLTKYDSFTTRLRKRLKRIVKPQRVGILLFSEDHKDLQNKMRPIDHAFSYQAEYDKVSPEYLKKVCESRLASNFSSSIDKQAFKMNWILITIVGLVILGIILKVMGVI